MDDDFDDIEHVTFCYFILGTAFPAIWGIFFLAFSWPGQEFTLFPDQCKYLQDWGLVVSGILFAIAAFYTLLTVYSIYANRHYDAEFNRLVAQENPKYQKIVKFEENYWRIIIIFTILSLFASFAIIDQLYGTEVLRSCGNIFKLAELFFYILCGFFSLIAIFSMIICSTERKPRDSDEHRINQQNYPRYAHPYNSIDDMF